MSVRDFMRTFGMWPWEVEQAAALGWVKLYVRPSKRGKGRPSRIAELIPQEQVANLPLPPYRNQIPREISLRHQMFTLRVSGSAFRGESKSWPSLAS
jgi:hypothetical protein